MNPARLQLDFRKPAPTAWRWLGWASLVAAALGVVALVEIHSGVVQRHATALSAHELLSQRLQANEPRRRAAAPDAQALAEIRRANAIIDQLTVPWDALFDAVEAADARGLGLLSLTPNARERTVRVSGEARNMADLLSYLDRVAAQPVFSQVHLVGHHSTQRDGAAVVSFTLAATWRAQS